MVNVMMQALTIPLTVPDYDGLRVLRITLAHHLPADDLLLEALDMLLETRSPALARAMAELMAARMAADLATWLTIAADVVEALKVPRPATFH